MQENDYSREAIGRRLKSGLVDAGISVEELADRIGRSRFTVSNWIQGKSGIGLDDAMAICNVLNWPLDRLARRENA